MVDYRFRSGAPITHTPLGRAVDLSHAAAHNMTMALAFDGHSDVRRDEALDNAEAALTEALRLVRAARTPPEPPRVAPSSLPTIFEVACDVVGLPQGAAA